jgi:hypothetical protein
MTALTRDLDADALTHATAARRAARIAETYAGSCPAARMASEEARDYARAAQSLSDSPFPSTERAAQVHRLMREAIRWARRARRHAMAVPAPATVCRWCKEPVPSVGAWSRDYCTADCARERHGSEP